MNQIQKCLLVLMIFVNLTQQRVQRNYVVDEYTKQRIEKENLETEEIRKNNPEGANKFPKTSEFTFQVRIVDTVNGSEEDFEQKQLEVNNIGTVFIYEKNNDVISITNSFSLHDVTSDADRIDKGICCLGISEIRNGLPIFASSSRNQESDNYSCVNINAKTQIWNICSTNESNVSEFKSVIRQWIFEDWYKSHELPVPETIIENFKPSIGTFSIEEQEHWPSTCHSQFQSPIAINDEKVEEGRISESIKFDYKNIGDTQIQWNGLNFIVTGEFGVLTHTWEYGQRDYEAKSLDFKFPSEHTLNGEQHFGELQVTHQSADGKTLVLSFFLTNDGSGAEGKFFTELNVDIWEQDEHSGVNTNLLDLNNLLVDGKSLNHEFNKSFYHYRGSLTSPPCTEGIEHFVLQTPVNVPKQTLQILSQKVLKQGTSRNNREINSLFGDLVLYVKMNDEIVNEIPDSIKDLLEEKKRQLERKSSQEAAEQEVNETDNSNEPQTKIDGHIIKTTEDVVELKYDTAETPEEAQEKGVDLSNLDSTEKAELRNGGTIQGDFDIPTDQVEKRLKKKLNRFIRHQ